MVEEQMQNRPGLGEAQRVAANPAASAIPVIRGEMCTVHTLASSSTPPVQHQSQQTSDSVGPPNAHLCFLEMQKGQKPVHIHRDPQAHGSQSFTGHETITPEGPAPSIYRAEATQPDKSGRFD